jgi:hypothetical protein
LKEALESVFLHNLYFILFCAQAGRLHKRGIKLLRSCELRRADLIHDFNYFKIFERNDKIKNNIIIQMRPPKIEIKILSIDLLI